MMIFQSSTHADRIVVALTLKDESGVEIIIPFTLDKQKEWMQVNIITSVYGKSSDGHPKYQWYINQIKDGRLLYINKEKAAQFLTSAGVQFPMEEQTSSFITHSIKTYEDLVKLQEEKKEELKMAEEMNRIHENQTSEKIGEVLSNPPMPEDDFMAAYYKEIADSIVEAEPPMPKEVADGLWKSAANLRQSMDEFEEAEEKCGPNIETWENYAPQHQEILAHIEKAGEAYREDKSHEERTQAVETARGTMESSKAFFETEREKLIEREKAYQEQIAAMQKEIETLKQETQQMSPEAMAKCLATAMQFMQEVEKTRAAAVDQPRVVSSELFASTRKAVKDAYFSVKLAPSKIKGFLRKKAHQAVDGILHQTAGVFDKGIESLSKKRDAGLRKSYEMQSADAFYREAVQAVMAEDKEDQHSYLTDLHAAQKMAKAGFGEYAIKKTLLKESPRRREMEEGQAAGIAKEVLSQKQQEKQNAKQNAGDAR